jgi:hypothetical protein
LSPGKQAVFLWYVPDVLKTHRVLLSAVTAANASASARVAAVIACPIDDQSNDENQEDHRSHNYSGDGKKKRDGEIRSQYQTDCPYKQDCKEAENFCGAQAEQTLVCGANLLRIGLLRLRAVHAGRLTIHTITTFLYGSSLYAKADGMMTASDAFRYRSAIYGRSMRHSGVSSFHA